MSALTKADLAEMLFDELGINKREAKEVVEMFYSEMFLGASWIVSGTRILSTSNLHLDYKHFIKLCLFLSLSEATKDIKKTFLIVNM